MDSTALDCPLVNELLALLAVLKSTMNCIQRLDLEHRFEQDQPTQTEQIAVLSQQLSHLHTVGLKLSARWDSFQDENDSKTDFVQSLACQVRNLVSIILNTSGLLERYGTSLEPARRQSIFDRIQRAIQELIGLLEETATLQGLTGLRSTLQLSHVDVELLCERVIREKKAAIPHRLIRFSRKGKGRLEQIDETWLRQTLHKVLDNAIAYSPKNSVINLKVIWTEPELVIRIQDMGIGIPEEALTQVCKPFYRAENAQSVSGMGLGLAIACQAMNQQKGSLEMTSQVGRGTTVTLHFPRERNVLAENLKQIQTPHLHPVSEL